MVGDSRSVEYWQEFEKPKIVYQVIQFHPCYAIDRDGMLGNNKIFFLAIGRPLSAWRF